MKPQRKGHTVSYHEHKFQYRSCRTNKHHILPEARKGQKTIQNLLVIEVYRHQAFHYLFHQRTLVEAAQCLLKVHSFNSRGYYGAEAYRLLFGERSFEEASELLLRLDSLKRHQTG